VSIRATRQAKRRYNCKMADWTFLTNHGLVLAAIAKGPRSTAREIGDVVGVTERAAHSIIKDLDEGGYISKIKVGRKNHYRIHSDVPLKDEVSDAAVGELLIMLGAMRRKATRKTGVLPANKG
jgi:predicted HTH transcriptional regulator